jgi:hypothetical protein
MARSVGDTLKHSAKEVATVVRQVQAEQDAARLWIVDRRSLAGEIGRTTSPRAPGGEPPPQPSASPRPVRAAVRGRSCRGTNGSACRWWPARHRGMLVGKQPRRIPEPRVADRAFQVSMMMKMVEPYISMVSPGSARRRSAPPPRRQSVPVMTGRARGRARLGGRLLRHTAGNVGTPGEVQAVFRGR